MDIISFARPEAQGLVWVIYQLVKGTSSVAAGVILFTLILKLITLPFDFISRFSMRKNSVKMEEMRPELERLQKQYADNKDLYNQKMMALYKKNGYSAFGACLPSLFTIVIFIVAINGFTSYSKFQNVDYYYEMSKAYNNVVYAGLETDDEYIKFIDDKIVVEDQKLLDLLGEDTSKSVEKNGHEIFVSLTDKGTGKQLSVYTTNGYTVYSRTTESGAFGTVSFSVKENSLSNPNVLKNEFNNNLINSENKTFSEANQTQEEFLNDIREYLSAEKFREVNASFLWVKNIWVADRAKVHPVQNYNEFKTNGMSSCASCKSCGDEYEIPQESPYEKLTAKLEKEKTEPNGYYILVVLTAGISLLTQLVMGKSQKAQMELQTVDGQGAQQQKIMMWMMPIMMAVFSFSYTAAFSIYIILSSVISIFTTLGINKIVDRSEKKKAQKTGKTVIRGRVYTQKEEPAKKPVEKKKQPEVHDFLSGTADKKGKKK